MFPLQETQQKVNRRERERESEKERKREREREGCVIPYSCSLAYNTYIIVSRESFMQSHYIKCVGVTCGTESNEPHNGPLSATKLN